MTQITDADLLRQKMRRIRHKMDDDVEGIVHNATKLMDYQYYINNYPWPTLAAATVLGYLLIPSPRSQPQDTKLQLDPEQLEKLMAKGGIVVQSQPVKEDNSSWKSSIFGWIARTAANAALAYGTVYFDQAVNNIVGSRTNKSHQP